MDQMLDRYVLFLSADFYADYWRVLIGSELSESGVTVLQHAARTTVADFMGNEDIYWNIDFSPRRHQNSFARFQKAIAALKGADRTHEEVLRSNYCEDESEQMNVAFALIFLHRITKDLQFRVEAGVSASDADVVAASIPLAADREIDTYKSKNDWVRSTSPWDAKIKSLTPDLPEYVALHFENACQNTIELPTLMANVAALVQPDVAAALMQRLRQGMTRQVPAGSSLKVPLAMRTV